MRISLAVESTNGTTYDTRLSALNTGAMFGGDVVLLENDPPKKIANALAREDSIVCSLNREKLAEMKRVMQDLATRVYRLRLGSGGPHWGGAKGEWLMPDCCMRLIFSGLLR